MNDTDWPPLIRSALFVPGARGDVLAKAGGRGADALIVDLEDAVAEGARGEARRTVATWLDAEGERGPAVCVRVDPDALADDLAAVVHPRLVAVVLPKVAGPGAVHECEQLLASAEDRAGLPVGRIRIWPLVESAAAVRAAYDIATASDRVAYMGGGTAEGGDLARSIGFRTTPAGLETLHIRSRVLVDVRAAGVPNPVTGLVASIADPAAVRTFAEASRDLGYEGMMAIHPAQVPIVNEVFGVTEANLAEARAIIAALQDDAVATYDGRMIDRAMARRAEDVLRRAGEAVR